MKAISIAVAGLALALIALTLVPSAGEYRPFLAAGALVCAAAVLVTIVTGWNERPAPIPAAPSPAAPTAPSPAAPPAPKAAAQPAGEADVVAFLALLQEKGRLIDFLQDDITRYGDAQVGAAARVVHQGCKAVLDAYLRIVPVRAEDEGTKVTVPAGYAADEYRLVGKISGHAPFSGTLMHRGWKVEAVNLPRVLRAAGDRFPIVGPAEVELR